MHTNMRGNGNQTKGAEELRMPFKELERMRFYRNSASFKYDCSQNFNGKSAFKMSILAFVTLSLTNHTNLY